MTFMDQNPLSFIFGTKPGAGVPTYEQLQMRRKIAESLLGQKSRYPKTFGEGLGAIGEAIGERGMMSRLEAMEQAKGTQDKEAYDAAMGPSTPPLAPVAPPMGRPMSYAPEDPGVAPAPLADAAAATGYRPAPAYLQAALASSGLPPERQAYLGHLAGKEAQSATEVSPTGATGPFQFIRSTGKQYGLVGPGGDKRSDITASIAAASKLTDDNTATLRAGLGREPTPGELALAHQQGAGTAVKMLSGAGNAPDYNLRVNNAGGLGGPSAAQKIMKYYGMPGAAPGPQSDAGPVVDPGLNQSVALNQTEPPAPAGPPTAFSGQPVSDAPPIGAPPDARMAITNAIAPKPPPVVAPPVPPAPTGPQIAQAPPQPQIRVPEREPVPPPAPRATERMRNIEKALTTIGDPMKRDVLTKRYQQEWADEQAIYKQKLEDYTHKRNRWEAAPEKALAMQKAQQDLIKSQQEADVLRRTGGLGNEPLLAPVIKSQEKVVGVPSATQSLRDARASLDQGMFTGTGAEQKLAIAKSKQALASMFGMDASDPRIASTETFRSAITPLIAQARSATVGNANISDADIKLAQAAAGGDITLDAKTFPKVLDALERINLGLAIGHQGRITAAAAGNETAAQALHGVYGLPMEKIIPSRFIQRLKEQPETAAEFDKTFQTPGLARKILGQ